MRQLNFAGTWLLSCLLVCSVFASPTRAEEMDARKLIEAAMDHWRGETSYSLMSMTIHRPNWERTMSMRAWTRGSKSSLVRVTAPKKDVGNGTLQDDKNMWTFSPKVNRIIKVPASMMNQGWMGSDFSNKDISRSTDIISQYDHTLDGSREEGGHTVYTLTSIPHEDAAVVWGKEVLTIRDDYILLSQEYWGQDGVLVKVMETREIAEMGGRTVAKTMRVSKRETEGEWTEITMSEIEFDIDLPSNIFTLSNLRNPRE